MGADKKSNLTKCGEILINIKTQKKKTKTYIFNCAYCNVNCDKLKKFSQHLEQEHFEQFSEGTEEKPLIFEPEIKLEEHLEAKRNVLKDNIEPNKSLELTEDPLETIELGNTTLTNAEELLDVKVKVENCNEPCAADDIDNNDELEYEDFLEENDDDYKPPKRETRKKSKKKSGGSSDVSSDNSNEDNLESNNSKAKTKTKRRKKSGPNVDVNNKEFIIALFEAFEKQPKLWKLKERTNDRNISQQGFETIANEVNEQLNININWHFAKVRINNMRIEYSYELEKQRKGEDHKIPWYYEHMKYLQENIDYMIKERHKKFERRLKHLDHSILPILIELYKKHEDLWQVNSIAFAITDKRNENFTKIIEELKLNHNHVLTMDNIQDYIKYINRLYSKNRDLQLKSELDKSEFKPTSPYFQELGFLAESQGPFKCEICNDIIQKYENYHMHIAEHLNNSKPFKCPLCDMGFKTFDIYIVHAKRHLSLNSFPCEICGKTYPFKSELDRHVLGHTGEKPFLCQICGTSFRVRRDYENHVRRHEQRFRYECHICKHGFNQLTTLNDHVKSHLNIRDIFCDICGKGFTAQRYLNNHKLIHEDKKRYKCMVCGKEFAQGAGYRAHRKQHQPHLTAAEIKRKKEESMDNLFSI